MEVGPAVLGGDRVVRVRAHGGARGAQGQGEARPRQLTYGARRAGERDEGHDRVAAERARYRARRARHSDRGAVGGAQVEGAARAELVVATCGRGASL